MTDVRCSKCGKIYRLGERHNCEGRSVKEAQQFVRCPDCGTDHPRGVVHVC